jgi:hypothetical protein
MFFQFLVKIVIDKIYLDLDGIVHKHKTNPVKC